MTLSKVIEVHGAYTLPAAEFYNAVDEAGYKFIVGRNWSSRTLNTDDVSKLLKTDYGQYALFRRDEGLVYLTTDIGKTYCHVAAHSLEEAEKLIEFAIERSPIFVETNERKVEVTFWSMGPNGPTQVTRSLDVPMWDDIKINYNKEVITNLDSFINPIFRPTRGGQLLLWHGVPGTGKTTALRALGREWKDWCEMHYIADPEIFFGSRADYMLQVMIEGAEGNKWRLLILEDCGELLSQDARTLSGQGLSRFLNAVDGLIGQGLRFMVLVTTNEDLGKMHDAVIRPGRCLTQLEFKKLNADEVVQWLQAHKLNTEIKSSQTLAALYAEKEDFLNKAKPVQKVGFGR